MSHRTHDRRAPSFDDYAGSGPENYERYFVPAIGAPLASALLSAADLRPGERVIDIACGTGIVARLARDRVGPEPAVTGVDINPGMLAVARKTTPPGMTIVWCEANAEVVPLPDSTCDVVLCQMGLQFFSNQQAALREAHRLIAPGGRLVLNVPGPTPDLFGILAEAMGHHIAPETAGFVHQVFSLHDAAELEDKIEGAGFARVEVNRDRVPLDLPPAAEFLWQYVTSTPLAASVAGATSADRAALESDVVARWEPYRGQGGLRLDLDLTIAVGRKP
jgi:ubiquinone/menaquinone biosynthesis C-methylase UbiE